MTQKTKKDLIHQVKRAVIVIVCIALFEFMKEDPSKCDYFEIVGWFKTKNLGNDLAKIGQFMSVAFVYFPQTYDFLKFIKSKNNGS